ncbi:hypothetical protein HELRODRAFT_87676, partial [Helobdella robusta]|uniref:ubiquitinyl hydrolase 1 n=1 Tax=Helobdella robusta TaxID=6412 RepID=T1G6U1_HELRO
MRNSSLATTSGSNNNNNNDPAEQNKNFSGNFVVESAEYTLILPDINAQPPDFRDFLKKDLIETSTLFSLELAGRLNWWVDLGVCRRLFPLVTIGDGNCLLHAASLALFGVHDNRLVLRQALSKMMCQSSLKDAFFRRWRWHQTIINKQSELVYTEDEWMAEWLNLGKLASTQPRVPSLPPNQQPHLNDQSLFFNNNNSNNVDNSDEILYESLEELHVFVLAHVLKRTIIIIADTILKNLNGEPLAPISFGGIYLPLELPPEECHRSPLLLTYDAAHFSALVPMENTTEIVCLADAVPLVDPDFELLPVHFAYDPGPDYQW